MKNLKTNLIVDNFSSLYTEEDLNAFYDLGNCFFINSQKSSLADALRELNDFNSCRHFNYIGIDIDISSFINEYADIKSKLRVVVLVFPNFNNLSQDQYSFLHRIRTPIIFISKSKGDIPKIFKERAPICCFVLSNSEVQAIVDYKDKLIDLIYKSLDVPVKFSMKRMKKLASNYSGE